MPRSMHNLTWAWAWLACAAGCALQSKQPAGASAAGAANGAMLDRAVTAAGADAKEIPVQATAAAGPVGGTQSVADAATLPASPANPATSSANSSGSAGSAPVAKTANAATAAASTAAEASPAAPPQNKAPDPAALLQVISELQAAGALDPETQQRLVADLRQTDPSLWPTLLQYFKTSIARQAAERTAAERARRLAKELAPKAPTDEPPASDVAANERPPEAPAVASDEAAPARQAGEPSQEPPGAAAEATAKARAIAAASAAPGGRRALDRHKVAERRTKEFKVAPPTAVEAQGAENATAPGVVETVTKPGPTGEVGGATPTQPAATASDPSPAVVAALSARDSQDWQKALQLAIDNLEGTNREAPQSQAEVGRHAALRMLYLLAGRKDEALRPIAGISPSQQDFWSQEVYGLATYLDTERNPESSRRAAEAVDRLRDAASRLGEHATLSVKNLALCTEVTSFGVYKPFEKLEFKSGQEVLLYAEVDNFKSVRGEKGFRTALRSSYQILDPHGARVDSQEFEITEEHCQNQRRDFFMRYHIWMPKRIYGGRYTLQLTIEDTLSQKIGQSSIEFDVKE